MHIPGFTEEDIRSALTIEDEKSLTPDQIDILTGLWTDIFDAILAAYTPAHAPMGESEIAAIKQIAMPYIKVATKEFFYGSPLVTQTSMTRNFIMFARSKHD